MHGLQKIIQKSLQKNVKKRRSGQRGRGIKSFFKMQERTAKYGLLYEFSKHKKVKNAVKFVTVDDNLQSFDTDHCGSFQMYFYLSLFRPLKDSAVARKEFKKVDVKLIVELLKKLFNANTQQNERILDAFIQQHEIKFDGEDVRLSDYKIKEV